jgi:serine/threonine-protein kinase HipA
MTVAEVQLWGSTIGAVSVERPGEAATFEYTPQFAASGIEVAPLEMPLSRQLYHFPGLGEAFHGLPGLLADSLPDKFGNAVLDAWLATQGRMPQEINAVERLLYTAARGMGALEFRPALGPRANESATLEVGALVELANEVLRGREGLRASLSDSGKERALREILRVGTSAGGARAKAVIAWNPATNEVRSGQVRAPEGFGYWLLKFDGVTGNRDRELADPLGYGAIEYAYSRMAQAAGVHMSECRLFEEGGRRHFMTRRFDRLASGDKLHMQSLAALAHLDFNLAGAHSYEQALLVARRLSLPMASLEELFRRMCFNVVARNQDDHVKNIAFLMDRRGRWSLAPAFDLTYSFNSDGAWTSRHQMTLHGKRDGFELEDFRAVARSASLPRGFERRTLEEVTAAVARWPEFASAAGVAPAQVTAIAAAHRLGLSKGR